MPNSTTTRRLLVVSLVVNLFFLAAIGLVIYKKGGIHYLGQQLGVVEVHQQPEDWQVDWQERYELRPNTAGEIIFVGDSITAAMPWEDYFSDIRNRGIGGDTSKGVLGRLDEITKSQPKQVFLNIGTNDLAKHVSVEQVMERVTHIVRQIHQDAPRTEIFVCSVLPINLEVVSDAVKQKKHKAIPHLNDALGRHANSEQFTFVDLYPSFTDENDYLKREWTKDGLHLNERGKKAYCELLRPLVHAQALPGDRVQTDR